MDTRAYPQRKTAVGTAPATTARPSGPTPDTGRLSGGQALDRRTNSEMSAKFGHNFSSVRIHTDSRAEESTAALGANAYALGNDIAFAPGRYQPGSSDGERLLAHELTHVVQQARFGPGDWGRQSRAGDASEREAEALAGQALAGQRVQAQAAPGAALARDESDAQNAWLAQTVGLDSSGDQGGGGSSVGPSAAQSSWVAQTMGLGPQGSAGPAATVPGAAQSAWVAQMMGPNASDGASPSGVSDAQNAWAAQTIGADLTVGLDSSGDQGGGGSSVGPSAAQSSWVAQTMGLGPQGSAGPAATVPGAAQSAWVAQMMGPNASDGASPSGVSDAQNAWAAQTIGADLSAS